MKKNNLYVSDDEIDLSNVTKTLWREKTLILFISIICGLLCYLYASFKPQQSKTVIKLKNIPSQYFYSYNSVLTGANIPQKFTSAFKLNFLSLDNLESFVEQSRDLDNFKGYLKSKNISTRKYFENKLGELKEKEIIIPNAYFLLFDKKILDGNIFINSYVEFIKKKNIIEFKDDLKLLIENKIIDNENALEIAKLINLENPIFVEHPNLSQAFNEPNVLYYKGIKVLKFSNLFNKKLLKELENDQFNFDLILDKGITLDIDKIPTHIYILVGLFFGFFLSFIIIFFKGILKNK